MSNLHQSLAALDAALSAPRPVLTPEQSARRTIEHNRQALRAIIGKAKRERDWLRDLRTTNPGAGQFYIDPPHLLANDVRRLRAAAHRGWVRLEAARGAALAKAA